MHKVIKIMGIVNVNDDSFYEESRVSSADSFRRRVDTMLDEGADIIDIGAASSRPGSSYCGVNEEWKRLEEVLVTIPNHYPSVRFSVDTFSSEICRRVLDTIGDFIVNDITAGEGDVTMLQFVGANKLEYVAMHNRGSSNVTADVVDYFSRFKEKALENGIERWILDPGFGFAKTVEQNLELLDNLGRFKSFSVPVLVGVSRKRMTGGSLSESCRLGRLAVENGADILRVHDVRETIASLI